MAIQLRHGQHISRAYNKELERIRSQVLRMGGLLETQLDQAIRALLDNDPDLAAAVRANDRRINDLELEIDAACIEVVARRQPAAGDLRFIVGVFKTIAELERMGDEAKRVAKMTAAERSGILTEQVNTDLSYMGEQVQHMLHDVLDAFARKDAEAALQASRLDRKIDQKYQTLTDDMARRMMDDPASVPAGLAVMWAARALERIGDRCQNIAEYVVYLVHGRDVRHIPLDELLDSDEA